MPPERRKKEIDLASKVDDIHKWVGALNTTIHGNGNPGMKTDLSNTILRVDNLEEDQREFHEDRKMSRGTIVTFICLALTCAASLAAAIIQ